MVSTATGAGGVQVPEPSITRFLFADTRTALLWLVVRVWLGLQWLIHGVGKLSEPGWIYGGAGDAVRGFAQRAMAQTSGEHPQVTGWSRGSPRSSAALRTRAFFSPGRRGRTR